MDERDQVIAALRAELANSVPRSRVVAMDEEIEALKNELLAAYAGAHKLVAERDAELAASKAENERLAKRDDEWRIFETQQRAACDRYLAAQRTAESERDALAERVKGCESIPVAERLPEPSFSIDREYDVSCEYDGKRWVDVARYEQGFGGPGWSMAYVEAWRERTAPFVADTQAAIGEKT